MKASDPQYQGDQSQQPNSKSGTPYRSVQGNPATAKTVVSHGLFGEVIDTAAGVNFHRPESNGNGVILDGMSREADYTPSGASTLDSPVPAGAPILAKGAMRRENLEHMGQGKGVSAALAGDVITEIGGVMSRGMLGTSTPGGGEGELTKDDTL